MPTKLTGIPSLAYSGVEAPQPPNITFHKTNPTTTDYFNFNTGDIWVNSQPNNTNPVTGTFKVWMLVAKNIHIATWIPFVNGIAGDLVSLTGNTGGTVFGDVNQNINVVGDNVGITIAGNPGTHTLTASLINGGSAVIGLQPDFGAVVNPIAGIINIHNPPSPTDGNILTQNGTINGDPTNYLDIRLANSINIINNITAGLMTSAGGGVNGNISAWNFGNAPEQFNMSINTINAGTNSSGLVIFKARGTASALTPIVSGDELGMIAFEGCATNGGTNLVQGAAILSVSSGTIGFDRVAGDLEFFTHPDAATSIGGIQRVVIDPTGGVTINQPDLGGNPALTSIGTYSQTVGATQKVMVIDNTGIIGAQPGAFVDWTAWTPTIDGAVGGVTTYTNQFGFYSRIGNMAFVQFFVSCSAATGTGNLQIGGLPFTINNTANYHSSGSVDISNAGGALTWNTYTMGTLRANAGSTFLVIAMSKSATAGAILQMANTDIQLVGSIMYRI